MSKLSLILCTFSVTSSVAGLFLTLNIVLQSKSYLKILGISYFVKNTNFPIILNIIESVIKSTYILNDIVLTSYSQVIKILSKSDIAII